ncbi:hypothetical protein SAMN02910289_01212 [Lachnospiraceae bacterium RM5]|nr:hypothetical protein SAMN02910289_01212 [Lachnospiraceae bacterium RM5]
MEENMNQKKSFDPVLIGYIVIIIGVVALVLSYVMVFSKYKTKNDDLKTKITEKQAELDDYNSKNTNLKKVVKDTKENNERFEKVLSRFDGGLSYEAEICDAIKIAENDDVIFDGIKFDGDESTLVYQFGNDTKVVDENGDPASLTTVAVVDSTNVSTDEKDSDTYLGKSIVYTLTGKGTYENSLESLRNIENTSGKRKVLKGLSFTYDVLADEMAYEATFVEYAVTGNGREPYAFTIPTYSKGLANIFYANSVPQDEQK